MSTRKTRKHNFTGTAAECAREFVKRPPPSLLIPEGISAEEFLLTLQERIGAPLAAPTRVDVAGVAEWAALTEAMNREAKAVPALVKARRSLSKNRRSQKLGDDELAVIFDVLRRYPRYGLKALCRKCVERMPLLKGRIGPDRMRLIKAQRAWPRASNLPSEPGA